MDLLKGLTRVEIVKTVKAMKKAEIVQVVDSLTIEVCRLNREKKTMVTQKDFFQAKKEIKRLEKRIEKAKVVFRTQQETINGLTAQVDELQAANKKKAKK